MMTEVCSLPRQYIDMNTAYSATGYNTMTLKTNSVDKI